MPELCHLIICRRNQAHQFQLNFKSRERAAEVQDAVVTRKNTIMIGGMRPPLTLRDDFGASLTLDDGDIGYVMLQEAEGNLEFRTEVTMLEAAAQARAQTRINATVNRNGILVPANASPQ